MPEPILIIDFEPEGLEATRACLRAAGMPAAVAGSPGAFSLAMRTTLPAIVVLEAVLPGLDGFRVCEVLKKGVGGHVPLVVLASRQMAEEMFGARGRQAGADWILELPRDEPKLVALCRDAMGPLPVVQDDAPAPEPPPPAPLPPAPRPPASVAPKRVATGERVHEPLGEADVDRILESAFLGVAPPTAVDGPDIPARLAPRPMEPPGSRPLEPARARPIEPPKPRPEPPLFDVSDAPVVRPPAARRNPSERLFSDTGPALDPRATIPLARVPGLEMPAEAASRDATPRPQHPPRATPGPSAPTRPRSGRSILRPLFMVGFVLGAGAAGYWIWEPATAETAAGLSVDGATEVTPTFRPLRPVPESAGSAENAEATPPEAEAAAPEPAEPAPAEPPPAESPPADSTPPELAPSEPAPPGAAPAGVAANAPADQGVVVTVPAQPLIPVLKPPIPASSPADVPRRSLPEPIAGTQVEPLYPAAARDAGLAGHVRMAVTVAPDGRVADITVLEESQAGAGFGKAAAAAVWQWRFRPAVRDGEAHTATVEIALQFNP